MREALLRDDRLNQICFVVRDIEVASDAFAKLLGIPKPDWFLTGSRDISQIVFNGEPTDARNKLIFINTPSVQIELIEPDQEPSTMRGFLDTVPACKTMVELLARDEPQAIPLVQPKSEGHLPLLGTDTLTQIALVVRDLDAAADAKARFLFIDTPHIQIELIQPGDSPSTWQEHLQTKDEGVHHVSFVVKNIEEKIVLLEQMGYPLIQKGNFWNGKGRYAYMDTVSTYHVIIELLEKYDG